MTHSVQNPIVNGVVSSHAAEVLVALGTEVTIAPSHCHIMSAPSGQPLAAGDPNNSKLSTRLSADSQYSVAAFRPSKVGTYRVYFSDPSSQPTFRSGYVDIVVS
jgi:hypothetical protein